MNKTIITVGFAPAWDITNYVDGIEWGQHKTITSQTITPAGKPLNVSKALAWMSKKSIAAGLWGSSDHHQLIEALSPVTNFIDCRFTVVDGSTRQNVTLVDTKTNRDIHLRAESSLATQDNIEKLKKDLNNIVTGNSTVVFAGSMPDSCLPVIKEALDSGADVVVDTSGYALTQLIEFGNISMIKPNLEELSQLIGKTFTGNIPPIVTAARSLCDRVQTVVVSLAENGAIAVTKDTAYHCKLKRSTRKVVNTVSCGDYLLAGFIANPEDDLPTRLQTAVKLATARAHGLTENTQWPQVVNEIETETTSI